MVGTVAKLTTILSVTIGKVVTINPVGFDDPISGAIIPSEGPTLGVVVAAYLISAAGSSAKPLPGTIRPSNPFGSLARAEVRLMVPGSSNDGRIISVDASTVAD